jgi:phytoene synthase
MAQDLSVQDEYCKTRAAPDGSNLYYATLFEPVTVKQLLFPVFALHYEIFDCLTASPDPGVTSMKLHWWSEELTRLFHGQPRHPISSRLLPLLTQAAIGPAPFLNYMALIESIRSRQVPASMDAWFNHVEGGFGQIWSVARSLAGQQDKDSSMLSIQNGGAIFTLDLLQNLNLLSIRGCNFLPVEVMEAHHIHDGNINDPARHQVASILFAAFISGLRQRLDNCNVKTVPSLPLYHRIMNRIARTVIDEIEHDGCQLLRHRIALTPLRKLWIAYRTRLFN